MTKKNAELYKNKSNWDICMTSANLTLRGWDRACTFKAKNHFRLLGFSFGSTSGQPLIVKD